MVTPAGGGVRAGRRVGVALGATELSVTSAGARASGARVERVALDRMSSDNGALWPALAEAFLDIARTHGSATLSVSLMGTLSEVRQLQLPPMRDADLQQLLSRSASRYFVRARSPQVVGALRAKARRSDSAAVPVVAAAASQRVVTAIHAAARAAGLAVECVVVAPGAWARAAVAIWPAAARGTTHVLVAQGEHIDALTLADGRLAGIRRFRAGNADSAELVKLTEAGRKEARHVFALGSADRVSGLVRALSELGVSVSAPPAEWRERGGDPEMLAAQFAGSRSLPALVSDEARALRATEGARALWRAAAVALSLLAFAAALEWWGLRREWRAAEAQREALRAEVAATLVGRSSVETALRQLATLNLEQRTSPRWGALIANISAALDDESYLTAFRARGDSVMLDGLAVHAARAFGTLEKTRGLTGVRAAAPVRREAPSDGPAMERFTIAARLAPRGKP